MQIARLAQTAKRRRRRANLIREQDADRVFVNTEGRVGAENADATVETRSGECAYESGADSGTNDYLFDAEA